MVLVTVVRPADRLSMTGQFQLCKDLSVKAMPGLSPQTCLYGQAMEKVAKQKQIGKKDISEILTGY